MRIEVDKDLCAGMTICTSIAPEVFELDDDGLSSVINPQGADDQTIMEAARDCPMEAIALYSDDGEQIWPK
jgi:ferredoxin